MGTIIIGFGNEHFREAIQVAVVGQRGVNEFLRGYDAMLLEHHEEHLGVDDRPGVEKLHAEKLTTDGYGL